MISKDLRIVFFGTPDFVIPVLETLTKNFTIVGVITTPDQKSGRKQLLTPTPIKQWATQQLTTNILTANTFTKELFEQLQSLNPGLFVVAAYGKIIPQEILNIPKFGSINIHPSLLPKYRGASPIQSAIFHGDEKSGVTIIKMDEQMDHGPILYAKEIIMKNWDTFDSLNIKMFQASAEDLPTVIDALVCEKLTPISQDDTKATFCDHITKDQGFFDISSPPSPKKLDRMIRAYYPWPTAWTKLHMADGTWRVVKLLPEKKIQMEGKNPVSYKDFLNGYPELKKIILPILPISNTTNNQ